MPEEHDVTKDDTNNLHKHDDITMFTIREKESCDMEARVAFGSVGQLY